MASDSQVMNVSNEEPFRAFMASGRPTVVCLCGSTRFKDEFANANLRETLAGRIVLSIGCDARSDDEIFSSMTPEEFERTKAALDKLHKHKIDLSDEILVLNVGGYIGKSTRSEILHAFKNAKQIRWLEDPADSLDSVLKQATSEVPDYTRRAEA